MQRHAFLAQRLELLRNERKGHPAAHVHGNGHAPRLLLALERNEGREQFGRQVVDAVVAGVFQRM
ncbi:hypothetical protein D3C72_2552160 [compost metagenome]